MIARLASLPIFPALVICMVFAVIAWTGLIEGSM